jgi:hypothetical protein
MVWSWDTVDRSATVLTIPDDTVIEGAYGYGPYSLSALWRLDAIDHRNGKLFTDSISNAVGVPLVGYFGPKTGDLIPVTDPVAYIRSVFSWIRIFPFLTGKFRSDIPPGLVGTLTKIMTSMRSDAFETVDFEKRSLTYEKELPDGTMQNVLDPERVDAVLKNKLEDPVIRKEGLSVTLTNSTTVPVLASRAARMLSRMGVLVLSLDNGDRELSGCEIHGDKNVLESETSVVIQHILQCKPVLSDGKTQYDLTVTIGTDFATRFVAKGELKR